MLLVCVIILVLFLKRNSGARGSNVFFFDILALVGTFIRMVGWKKLSSRSCVLSS